MNLLTKHIIIFLITLLLSYILVYDLVDFFRVQKEAYFDLWERTSNHQYHIEYLSSINKMYLSILFSTLVITPVVGQIALYFELEKRRIENFFTSYSKLNIIGIVIYIFIFLFWLIKPDFKYMSVLTYITLPIFVCLLIYRYHQDAK
ncbi:MAG: hypothetical protein CVV63_04120 [Tenericutes bacterium HGW-Tenericutes-8]|nr:MAG: hypothetical protein CVV63_04120 [Tenericutes bacterium HGW-Tenericutes-8]